MIKRHLESLDPNGISSLCILGVIGTIGSTAMMLLPILVGVYVDYLGFADDTAGVISSASMAGTAAMILIVSLTAKHWQLKTLAAYGLAAMILFDILSLYFQSVSFFTFLRFLAGMGGGAAMAAVAAAIARLPHSDKGYGIYICIQFALPMLGLYFFPRLLPDIGFNGMMEILIALEIVALLMVPVFINYPLPATDKHTEVKSNSLGMSLILQKPALLSIIAFCVYGAANSAIWAYAERIGINNVGLSGENIGDIISVSNIMAIFAAFLVICLQGRFGHMRPLSIGISIQLVAMLIFIYFPSFSGYTLAIILFQMAWAFAWPYFLSIQADIDHSGTVVVAGSFANLLGNSLGAAMAAFFVGGGEYVDAIWLACGFFVISMVLMLAINRMAVTPQSQKNIDHIE